MEPGVPIILETSKPRASTWPTYLADQLQPIAYRTHEFSGSPLLVTVIEKQSSIICFSKLPMWLVVHVFLIVTHPRLF